MRGAGTAHSPAAPNMNRPQCRPRAERPGQAAPPRLGTFKFVPMMHDIDQRPINDQKIVRSDESGFSAKSIEISFTMKTK